MKDAINFKRDLSCEFGVPRCFQQPPMVREKSGSGTGSCSECKPRSRTDLQHEGALASFGTRQRELHLRLASFHEM